MFSIYVNLTLEMSEKLRFISKINNKETRKFDYIKCDIYQSTLVFSNVWLYLFWIRWLTQPWLHQRMDNGCLGFFLEIFIWGGGVFCVLFFVVVFRCPIQMHVLVIWVKCSLNIINGKLVCLKNSDISFQLISSYFTKQVISILMQNTIVFVCQNLNVKWNKIE